MIDHNFKFYFKQSFLSMKIMGLIVSAFLILFQVPLQASEQWYLPIEKELKTLQVINRDNQAQQFWLSGPISEYMDPMEYSYEVPAFGKLEIPLIEYSRFPWVRIKTPNADTLQMNLLTSYETSILIPSGPSLRWKNRIRGQSEALILNLAPFEQWVTITPDSQNFQRILVPALGKVRVSLEQYNPGSMLIFQGQARIAGLILSPLSTKGWAPDSNPVQLTPIENSEAAYFRVSNRGNSQSYIAQITDPDLIAQARLQVSQPQSALPRILIGEIEYGNGDVNRDFSEIRSTPWSWNIKRVIRFAQLASQECDGSPEMLEEVLKPWKESWGIICFWGYRIVEELSFEQITTGQMSRRPAPWSLRREPELETRRPSEILR